MKDENNNTDTMEKLIEETFKIFSHLARDIQTYMIAGCIILANLYLIDRTYCKESISQELFDSDYLVVIVIISSYVLGQICLAFYTFILELLGIDKFLYKRIFKKRFSTITDATDEAQMENKGNIFKANQNVYIHFIERDVNLSTLRWNYSSAFLICSIIDFSCYFSMNREKEIVITAILAFFISICLFILHIFTQKETGYQIEKLK